MNDLPTIEEISHDTDVGEFWLRDRVPRGGTRARFQRWFQTDSEEAYRARGNKNYSADSVSYQFNSLGYRGPEFRCDPGEHPVIFVGDSNTFGLGTPWEGLWTTLVSNQLQEYWQAPVRQCNLAWGATGPDYPAMVVHQTAEVLKPSAVFVLWSFFDRMTWFPEYDRVVHFMPQGGISYTAAGVPVEFNWSPHKAYVKLAEEAHGFYNFVRNFHHVNERLLRLMIPFYWGTLQQVPPEKLKRYVPLDGYVGVWEHNLNDLARDGLHSGLATHAAFASAVMAAIKRDRVLPAGRK